MLINYQKLAWTTPANAVKFHFVWSNQTISEEHTIDPTKTNWWAAGVIGTDLKAVPGSRQTISFDAPEAAYVAMFTWDSIGNMSPMSNVAVTINGTFPGVTSPTTTGDISTTGNQSGDQSISKGLIEKVSVLLVLACSIILLL